MALVRTDSGNKVGWAWYTTKAEALARGAHEDEARDRMLRQGYDFGYLWPGTNSVRQATDGTWMVVTT